MKISFQSASRATQRRRTRELANHDWQELGEAAIKRLKLDGNEEGADLMKIALNHEEPALLLNKIHKSVDKLSVEEACIMMIKGKLTHSQYETIADTAKASGHDIYPNIKQVTVVLVKILIIILNVTLVLVNIIIIKN